MRLLALAAVMGCGAGCGSDDCSPEDIDGTYVVTTLQVGGDCGEIGTVVVQYNKGESTTETGCVVDYERLSKDQCTVERAFTCTSAADDEQLTGVGSVTQKDGGDRASGTISITVRRLSTGATVCTGTYDATYKRQ